MEKKQVGTWRLPAELTECRQGAEIVLVFDNWDEYQGIFRGFDNEEIVLQGVAGSQSKIGLPLERLYTGVSSERIKPIDAVVYPSDEAHDLGGR